MWAVEVPDRSTVTGYNSVMGKLRNKVRSLLETLLTQSTIQGVKTNP